MTTSRETRFAVADVRSPVDAFLARRVIAGWTPRAIATAGGVTVRTAYRWRREIVAVEELTIGGWTATFAIRRTKPPLRLTEWRR